MLVKGATDGGQSDSYEQDSETFELKYNNSIQDNKFGCEISTELLTSTC